MNCWHQRARDPRCPPASPPPPRPTTKLLSLRDNRKNKIVETYERTYERVSHDDFISAHRRYRFATRYPLPVCKYACKLFRKRSGATTRRFPMLSRRENINKRTGNTILLPAIKSKPPLSATSPLYDPPPSPSPSPSPNQPVGR